jgi:hypothetical protein
MALVNPKEHEVLDMGNDSFKLPSPRDPGTVTPDEQVQLAKYVAPAQSGGNGNAELGVAARLADALDEIPLFAGIELAALVGGSLGDAGAWPDGVFGTGLVGMGAQPGESYFLHLKFPQAKTRDVHNVMGLLKSFSHGWEAGLASLLAELGYDGNTYMEVFSQAAPVQAGIKRAAADLFSPFTTEKPPVVDPFAQPTGLQPAGATGLAAE